MKFLILIAIFQSLFNVSSKAQVITFEKRIGYVDSEYGKYIQQTSDNGYIVVGEIYYSSSSESDIYLFNLDSAGNTSWIKTYGSPGNSYLGACVQITNDSGYVISGTPDMLRLDFQKNTLWSKNYGISITSKGRSVIRTYDGGYMVLGGIKNGSNIEVMIIKMDEQGDSLWSKTIGGDDRDYGYSISQTTDSGFIVVGKTRSYGEGWIPDWYYDTYIIKTDKYADTLWTKYYGGLDMDEANDVQQTPDGGFIVVGNTRYYYNNQKGILLIKTDQTGDTLWTRVYGDTVQTSMQYGYSVRLTNDGGYVIGGAWNGRMCLIKTNADGDMLWKRTFTASGTACVQNTTDGGYVLVGTKYISLLTGYDIFVVKTDSLGYVYSPSGLNEPFSKPLQSTFKFNIYPNPIIESAAFNIVSGESDFVSIIVHDVMGKPIQSLFNGQLKAHEPLMLPVKAGLLSAGVYFILIKGSSETRIEKIAIIK